MKSNIIIIGLFLLVCTNLGIMTSISSPSWLEMKRIFQNLRIGLWVICDNDNKCYWTPDATHLYENVTSLVRSAWFIAVQGLMSVGLAVSLTALLIATLALCCNCNCNYGGFIAGLLVTAFLATGAAVTVFGIYASKGSGGFNASIEYEFPFYVKFGWSFWLAAGASGMALLSSFLYACGGRE